MEAPIEPGKESEVAQQLAELRARIARLETLVTTPTASAPYAPKPNVAGPPNAPAHEIARPPTQIPSLKLSTAPENSASNLSLENRIGTHWFNRIGILAILIGAAWFLKFAIDNNWIGPATRVLIGLVAGLGIIAWSERFERRGYSSFGYTLKAVGTGILYLSLWASFSLFHLISATVAFAAMIVVTALNGFLSWLRNTELLALYAIVGGMSTPLLLSTGENHEATLFGYLLLLDIAVLVLVVLRSWTRLTAAAFVGTVLYFLGWWSRFYTVDQRGLTAFFLTSFFLIFALAPRFFFTAAEDDSPRARDRAILAFVVLPVMNAVLGFLVLLKLYGDSWRGWGGAWLAIAFAAFYLLTLRLPQRAGLRRNPERLSAVHLTLTAVFLILAIPLKTHGRWLTTGWLVEGAALAWLARRSGSLVLRGLALLCLTLGVLVLLANSPHPSTTPLWNARFATYLVGICAFVFVARIAGQSPLEDNESVLPWHAIAAGSGMTINILVLIALALEIHNYWWFVRWLASSDIARDFRMYAQFSYSALFMVYGAALLTAGFWRRSAFLRWQALFLLAGAIAKVFLLDINQLSKGFRILSFLGLGALLLTVSFSYQRDWLNLRTREPEP